MRLGDIGFEELPVCARSAELWLRLPVRGGRFSRTGSSRVGNDGSPPCPGQLRYGELHVAGRQKRMLFRSSLGSRSLEILMVKHLGKDRATLSSEGGWRSERGGL